MRLLVVDYDYFFPSPDPGDPGWEDYDWGHSENHTPLLQEVLWEARASGFILQDKPLPLTSGLEQGFWERFTFSRRAHGYVSESNFFSMHPRVRRGVNEVVLFDAHHDCGYDEEAPRVWNCANWGLYYLLNHARMEVNYPGWRINVFKHEAFCYAERLGYGVKNGQGAGQLTRQFDPGGKVEGTFDKVHICRSGAWVPPWCDHLFQAFVERCPVRLQAVEILEQRPFDESKVFAETQVTKVFYEKVWAHNQAAFAEYKRAQAGSA